MAGLLAVIVVGALVASGILSSTETKVFHWINHWPQILYRPMWVFQLFGVIGALPLAAVAAAIWRRLHLAAALVTATLLKVTLEAAAKTFVQRDRPAQILSDVILRGKSAAHGLSFPSGHAMVVFALATLIVPYLKGRWRVLPWALAAAAGISRVYLGAHFPLDVVAGAGLGMLIGGVLNLVFGVPGEKTELAEDVVLLSEANERSKPRNKQARKRAFAIARIVVGIAVAIAIFALIIPKIASYSSVWKTLTTLTWSQLLIVTGAMVFNLFTYWWQMMAAMPGLTTAQAAVNNQTGTTIADVIPAGGVISLGVVVEMFRSWGFSPTAISLEITLTGIWNSFLKLGLPIVALALLAITGKATAALLAPALFGLVVFAGAVLVFALMLWKKSFARAIGNGLGAAWSWLRRIVRRPPVTTWGEGAVRFRKSSIALIQRRWIPLTLTTILSHLALFFVLLLSLRFVGVSGSEVSWAQALAVFAFARLLSAIPLTPGGLGVVELALIAGLYAAGRHHVDVPLPLFRAQVTAAVFLFRALTYGIQIPLGGLTYVIWLRNKGWRKPQSAHVGEVAAVEGARR